MNIPLSNSAGLPNHSDATPDLNTQVLQQQNMRAQNEMQQFAMRTSAQTNALSNAVAMLLNRGNSSAAANMMSGDGGKVLRDSMGILQARGMFGGGSPVNLMTGIQQMVSASQMRVGGNAVMGQGAVSNEISKAIYTQMQQQVFNKFSGGANSKITRGFDNDQMGQIFSVMGASGATQGMKMFDGVSSDKDGIHLKGLNTQLQKVMPVFKDFTNLFATMRNITGSSDIVALMANAERVTGMSLGRHSAKEITRRIDRIRDTARATNHDANAALQATASNVEALTPMFGSTAAGAIASTAVRNAMSGVGNQKLMSIEDPNYKARSSEDIQKSTIEDIASIAAENPDLVSAYAMKAISTNPDSKSSLTQAINKFHTARTPRERDAARSALRGTIDKIGSSEHINTDRMTLEQKFNFMGAQQSEEFVNRAKEQSINENPEAIKDLIEQYHNGDTGGFNTTEDAAQAAHALSNFDPKTQAKLIKQIREGGAGAEDLDEYNDVLKRMGLSGGINDEHAGGLGGLLTGPHKQQADMMARLMSEMKNDTEHRFDSNTPAQTLQRDQDMAAQQILADRKITGTSMAEKGGWVSEFLGGMSQQKDISQNDVLHYMGITQDAGLKSLTYDKNGFSSATDDDFTALDKATGGKLATLMQASGAQSGSEFMRNKSNFAGIIGAMKDTDGLRFGDQGDGKLQYAQNAEGDAAEKKLQKAAIARQKFIQKNGTGTVFTQDDLDKIISENGEEMDLRTADDAGLTDEQRKKRAEYTASASSAFGAQISKYLNDSDKEIFAGHGENSEINKAWDHGKLKEDSATAKFFKEAMATDPAMVRTTLEANVTEQMDTAFALRHDGMVNGKKVADYEEGATTNNERNAKLHDAAAQQAAKLLEAVDPDHAGDKGKTTGELRITNWNEATLKLRELASGATK